MERTKLILRKILHPPKAVLCMLPPVAFAMLIFIFVKEKQESEWAYFIYFLSAYSLTVLLAELPHLIGQIKNFVFENRLVKAITSSVVGKRFLTDMSFRGGFSIYQGMTVNFLYALFRTVTGVIYSSAWFISLAVYHFILGGIRAYLVFAFNRSNKKNLMYEYRCYQKTAWLLFVLNIPMVGMVWLMIKTNSGFTYPGYVIYLSALYTFYTMGMAIRNLVKYKRLGSPILSAAKVLNFVSAMMSVLGLQTAMISAFSENGDNYRRMMNTITGCFVCCAVIAVALYMIANAAAARKRVVKGE